MRNPARVFSRYDVIAQNLCRRTHPESCAARATPLALRLAHLGQQHVRCRNTFLDHETSRHLTPLQSGTLRAFCGTLGPAKSRNACVDRLTFSFGVGLDFRTKL